ncbi:ubiquitin carboxyl-terminal hydrolase 23 [Typha angustifolia]|uniref:ubiquitin carboxyl-terminal hydrolase 23 n=1 Tax=Typha angustifolia TaxID=59011 RepID=UPI003C2DB1D1
MAGVSSEGGGGASFAAESVFGRRIEFHPARKPFSAISSGGGGGFYLETLNPSPDPQGKTAESPAMTTPKAAGKRSEGGEFYEHRLDPELSLRITFRRIGAGLANLGNTCFLNSVLQCLTYTEPFAAYLQSGKHKTSCRTAGFCAMCALQNHVMVALQSTGKILSPSHLVKNLRCISRNFRNFRQEDAHEYMVNLLESMHKCCLPSGVPTESPNAYEKSLIHMIFGGRLRSQVKCMQCSYCSNKFDPFLDLSLEIVKANSLRKALSHFTEVEQLDGGERQYQCQRCKQKVRALKQLTIHKAPNVLTIHLKRFDSHIPGQKIDKRVDFESTLDLKPFVSDPPEGDLKYTLYGVLVHAGWSTQSGHYYCYVRTSSGMWHSLDDNKVYQVSEKTVLAQKAYMLFYFRDRSSTIKKDVVHKNTIFANSHGNKLVLASVSSSKGAVQNGVVERKLSTSACSSMNFKTDAIADCQSIPATNMPVDQPAQGTPASLQKNDDMKWEQDPISQKNSLILPNKASKLQTNGDAMSTEMQQMMLNCTKSPCLKDSLAASLPNTRENKMAEDSKLQDKSKDKGLSLPSLGIDARNHLHDSSNMGMKSNYLNQQKKKLLSGTDVGKVEINNKHGKLQNQPDHLGGFIQSGASRDTAPKDQQSLNLQCQNDGENLLKVEKPELVSMLRTEISTNSLLKEVAESGTKPLVRNCYEKGGKPQKLANYLIKSMPFGRKQLLLSSLKLHKSKNLKRSRKHSPSPKHLVEVVLPDDLFSRSVQGMSVSAKIIDSKILHRNCPHSSSYKELSNGDVGVANEIVHKRDSKVDVTAPTCEHSRSCLGSTSDQCNLRETDANEKDLHQNEFLGLLSRGLTTTTVAQWDNIEMPKLKLHSIESSRQNSIGYVLDEWDEEYDRGRRKKVKSSKESFDGPNPFQDTANMKARERMKFKVDQTRLGNQPLRI